MLLFRLKRYIKINLVTKIPLHPYSYNKCNYLRTLNTVPLFIYGTISSGGKFHIIAVHNKSNTYYRLTSQYIDDRYYYIPNIQSDSLRDNSNCHDMFIFITHKSSFWDQFDANVIQDIVYNNIGTPIHYDNTIKLFVMNFNNKRIIINTVLKYIYISSTLPQKIVYKNLNKISQKSYFGVWVDTEMLRNLKGITLFYGKKLGKYSFYEILKFFDL